MIARGGGDGGGGGGGGGGAAAFFFVGAAAFFLTAGAFLARGVALGFGDRSGGAVDDSGSASAGTAGSFVPLSPPPPPLEEGALFAIVALAVAFVFFAAVILAGLGAEPAAAPSVDFAGFFTGDAAVLRRLGLFSADAAAALEEGAEVAAEEAALRLPGARGFAAAGFGAVATRRFFSDWALAAACALVIALNCRFHTFCRQKEQRFKL